MPFGYVVDRLLFAQRLQRYFTFEFSGEFTSFFHRLLVSYFFLATCPTLRDQLIRRRNRRPLKSTALRPDLILIQLLTKPEGDIHESDHHRNLNERPDHCSQSCPGTDPENGNGHRDG